MAWWRRNHSFMCRSPIHHYAQRMLRKHDAAHAALRTRGFSRNPSSSAQHKNGRDDTNKRPENMSELEWLQLQHFQGLRKRLVDDPYKALFGASNDMLSGKGLADWEWIHKSFPKWMLNEMDNKDRPPERSEEKSKYPKKVEIRDGYDPMPRAREPLFAEPAFRKTPFERGSSSGIVSPSDLRRPQESSYFKVVGASNATNRSAPSDESGQPQAVDKKPSDELINLFATGLPGHKIGEPYPANSIISRTGEAVSPGPNAFESRVKRLKSRFVKHRASDHEPVSSEDSTANTSTTHGLVSNAEVGDSKAWRQTAVSRRAVRSVDNKTLETSAPVDYMTGEVIQSEQDVEQRPEERNSSTSATDAPTTRPTSDILKQLPQDDIDFLSAAEIRATMGVKRSQVPSDEERKLGREKLEQSFIDSREPPPIHPMLEAKIVNNQQVRRTEREMREARLAREVDASQKNDSSLQDAATDVSAETSIDKMRKWLENTGASFAKQFWQDPAEHSNVTEMKTYYDATANRVKKGQAAIRAIVEDLERDVPASKALLKRLKSDEEQLDSAMHMLRRRSSDGQSHVPSPRKTQNLGSLETRFNQTNAELEKAYTDLRGLVGTEAVTNATDSFQRRLTTASEVLQKNTHLLRVLAWSLQRRREHPNINSNMLSDCQAVTDNLLSLRDTQTTMVRLLDRAMLVYGVVPNAAEAIDAAKAEHSQYENCEDPFVRARLAADAHLINEIKAHKTVVHAPAKEPVSRPVTSGYLDIPNPLAHSLFRPFGPVVEKLGSKETQEHADKVDALDEAVPPRTIAAVEGAVPKPGGVMPTLGSDPTPTAASFGHDIRMPMTGHEAPYHFVSPEASDDLGKTTEAASTLKTPAQENETPADIEHVASTSTEPEVAPADLQPQPVGSIVDLPTHYTILVREPQTDTLSITTSTTGPPRDTSPAVPLHRALSSLDSPAKFIPYITAGLEVVSAKNDILVLRDAIDSPACIRPFETVQSLSQDDLDTSRGTTNPIDGTTRLSPTGYVGPEESAEQLEKEFEERRQAAGRMSGRDNGEEERPRKEGRKAKRDGGAGGVVKTAIWVAGMCYVAGVIGEILT